MKRYFMLAVLMIAPLTFGGCVGDLQELVCAFLEDPDHCYQGAAVQEGQSEECEKIKGEGFTGSNPPRDKCYLLIAENTGDLNACKQIKGGLMSYTQEECFLSVAVSSENPEGCKLLTGESQKKCRGELGAKITSDKVLEIDNQIQVLKDELKNGSDAGLEAQLKGLEDKKNGMLEIMTPANKDEYAKLSDPINQVIIGDFAVGELDSAMKTKLIALNESLKAKGLKLDEEKYEAIKDYYKFVNDPANDIEKMNDDELVKDRWNEKIGNVVDKLKIWKTNDTAEEKALDQQLRFYERMLERQAAIAAGLSEKQEDFERNVGLFSGGGADFAKDKAQDYILTQLFGAATSTATGVTTKVIGEALDTVKGEAKSAEFRGLVRAYNQGMADELGKFGGDVDKAHAEVIKQLQADPYRYAEGNSFAKYGNILENKDCDGSNPHCINRDVFWKAMKKSYNYQHK